MFSRALGLFAAVSALLAVSCAHEKMSLQHQFKWVDDTATPISAYLAVTNVGDGGSDSGSDDGYVHGDDLGDGQGPPPRAHGGWNGEGVLEIQSGWNCDHRANHTTVPVGQCLRNVLAPKGDFMVLLTKPADSGMFVLGVQGFSDDHCGMAVGKPFKAQVMDGCSNGVGIQLASHRTPHPVGVTTRVYHNDSCGDGYIDFWVPDDYCSDGTMFSHGSKSFVANCENDYVVEFDQEGCMGMSTYHALHDMNLGVCHATRRAAYEVVCGGVLAPARTGPDGTAPTLASIGESAEDFRMDPHKKLSGSVTSGQTVRYIFDWKPEMSDWNSSIWLQAISHHPVLRVHYFNPSLNMTGVYPCIHASASLYDDWDAAGIYYGNDINFDTYCSSDCQILIVVYGDSNSDSHYTLEIKAGPEYV
jgi:hypothetical protein